MMEECLPFVGPRGRSDRENFRRLSFFSSFATTSTHPAKDYRAVSIAVVDARVWYASHRGVILPAHQKRRFSTGFSTRAHRRSFFASALPFLIPIPKQNKQSEENATHNRATKRRRRKQGGGGRRECPAMPPKRSLGGRQGRPRGAKVRARVSPPIVACTHIHPPPHVNQEQLRDFPLSPHLFRAPARGGANFFLGSSPLGKTNSQPTQI